MTTYFCKCGRIVRKSTDADTTGNRDVEGCTGCPYLLPWGKQAHSPEKGWYLDVKGYECRISKDLEYASQFCGNVDDKCSCYIASLDYEFLTQIGRWIRETYPDGELINNFSLKSIRPTDFSSNGRYREPLYCAQNKKGMAAKAALMERFFNPDGSRKDMTPEEEERKIKDVIENGKRAAQGGAVDTEQAPAAPEQLPAVPAAADADTTTEALATVPEVLPAFDTSGFDIQTRDSLHVAETMIRNARKNFISEVADAVAIAHDALCGVVQNLDNSKHGNRGEAAFCTWCASMGIKKSTAYNLLQVSNLFSSSSPVERQVLEQAQPSLLYAAAKPSAPAAAVEAVKSGDITTLKEYKGLLEEINAREEKINELIDQSEKIEQRLEASEAENRANNALLVKEQRRREDAEAALHSAEQNAEDAKRLYRLAEDNRNAMQGMLQTARTRSEVLESERDEARAELAALQSRPIEVAVAEPDPAEIERLANERAESIAAQRTALLEAQMRGMQQDLNDLRDSAYQAQASGVDTVFAFAANAAGTIDTLRETFLELAKDLQEDDFWSALQPMADAAWKIADIAASVSDPELAESEFEESEVAQA